jgi:rRNA maturation RNase YbeY
VNKRPEKKNPIGKRASKKRSARPSSIKSHIRFHSDLAGFSLSNSVAVKKWLQSVAVKYKRKIGTLNFCFVSDDQLLAMNKHYLRHDTFTDIITFDYSSDEQLPGVVSGEIFISMDRVKENAGKFKVTFKDELHRVMAHGLLHLCGLHDKSASESKRMRSAEENALDLRHF